MAGELNIVCHGGVSEMEKEARLRLFVDVYFLLCPLSIINDLSC